MKTSMYFVLRLHCHRLQRFNKEKDQLATLKEKVQHELEQVNTTNRRILEINKAVMEENKSLRFSISKSTQSSPSTSTFSSPNHHMYSPTTPAANNKTRSIPSSIVTLPMNTTSPVQPTPRVINPSPAKTPKMEETALPSADFELVLKKSKLAPSSVNIKPKFAARQENDKVVVPKLPLNSMVSSRYKYLSEDETNKENVQV